MSPGGAVMASPFIYRRRFPMAPKEEKTVECEILRDVWDEDGTRHRKGKVVSLPVEAAMDGVEVGALRRVKK